MKNTHIDEIIIFISDDSTLELKSPKIKIVNLQIRPTFKYLFEYCNDNFQNQKCIIANTDIFFDDSCRLATSKVGQVTRACRDL